MSRNKMNAREIISEQALRAIAMTGTGMGEKCRENFKKYFENICLAENWNRIKCSISSEKRGDYECDCDDCEPH